MGDEVVGFYTLVVAQVEYDDAPDRLGKGLARHAIPLMLLARLAIATSWQGKGLGSGLLKDAMLRTLQAADIAEIRAMAVHARMTTRARSTSVPVLCPLRPIRTTCSCCSRTFARSSSRDNSFDESDFRCAWRSV